MEGIGVILAVLWLLGVAVFLAALIRQYVTYPVIRPHAPARNDILPFISVIVPARNEEANIARCIAGLLEQSYPHDLYEIIVVDDASTDRTATVVAEARRRHSTRVELLQAGPIPEGWLGKTNACRVGAAHARGEVLCFIDADTFAAEQMLASCWSAMETRRCDLLSFTPHEEMLNAWERAIMPWGFLLLAFAFDFRKVNQPGCAEALANGQCMLFRRKCYDAIGGHGCVRDQVLEDIELAAVVKERRYRLYFARGERLATTRMYRTFSDFQHGMRRITRRLLRHRGAALGHISAAFALALLPFGAPIAALVSSACHISLPGALAGGASLLFLGTCGWACRYFRIPVLWAGFAPFGFGVWAILVCHSQIERDRALIWKGRLVRETRRFDAATPSGRKTE